MPSFENKGTKYLFHWDEYALNVEVSRISSNHETTKCQILFTTTDPNCNPHLLQTRFNLESSRSRSELAKDMAGRYKVKGQVIDWKSLLEYVSIKAIRESEQGEPVIILSSLDEVKPLEYLIDPIIPLNKPTVLFGDPGAGKSQLMVALNILTGLPWADNPLRLGVPNKPVVSLILDYEADPDDIRRQVGSLIEGMGLGFFQVNYRRCALPIADDIEAIRNHIEAINATCIFIDSVSLAAGGDLNAMNVATAYFRSLRQLKNVTSVSLAHTSKDRENKSKTILGSVLFEAGARSVWEVRGQEDENSLDIALFHRKANLSKKSPPLGYRITYENSLPVNITWHDPKSVAEFVERMGTNQRIIAFLKESPATEQEIQESLDITPVNCRVTMSRLKKKNIAIKVGDKWGLVTCQ